MHLSRNFPAILSILLFPFSPGAANGQAEPRTIRGGPDCQNCAIERHLLATIHDSTYEGGAIGDGGAKAHVNSDGTFLVIAGPGIFNPEIYFVGRNGGIEHRIGRTGEGPGEYKRPMHVMESGPHYLVADAGLARSTYLGKSDLEVDHTSPIPGRISGTAPVSFSDGSYVMWATVGRRESAGFGLHHVSADGQLLRSFGPGLGGDLPALAASGDTAVWVAFDSYRIEKWSTEGELLAEFVREADWVKPEDDLTEPGDPYTWLSGLWEDENGLLWVLSVGRRYRAGPPVSTDQEISEVESVIEVLDPKNLIVVAHSVEQGRRELVIPGRGFHTGEIRTTPTGLVLTDIWRFRLLRSP